MNAGTTNSTETHPEVNEISDLTEGLLPASRARSVRAHLAGCELCSDIHQSLEDIRSTLGTLPDAERMPDDVAERIDAALAAESLLATQQPTPVSRETTAAEPAPVSRETTPTHGFTSARPVPRSSTRPGTTRRGSTRPNTGRPSGRRSGRTRRLRVLLSTAGALAALGLGGVVFQAMTGDGSDNESASQQNAHSGDAQAGPELERRVQHLLAAQAGGSKPDPGLSAESRDPNDTAPLAGGPRTVPTCVREALDRREAPLAAEPGQPYDDRPTYLVLLPHPGDSGRVDAYVVDSTCTTETGSGAGEVLTKRTYTKD